MNIFFLHKFVLVVFFFCKMRWNCLCNTVYVHYVYHTRVYWYVRPEIWGSLYRNNDVVLRDLWVRAIDIGKNGIMANEWRGAWTARIRRSARDHFNYKSIGFFSTSFDRCWFTRLGNSKKKKKMIYVDQINFRPRVGAYNINCNLNVYKFIAERSLFLLDGLVSLFGKDKR